MQRVDVGNEEVERERRQLDLMLDRLTRFRSGELGIGIVIGDLEGLLHQLDLVDEPWRDAFTEAWSDLEIPYAVALDRLEPIPTIDDETVNDGVCEIERLVSEALSRLRA